MFENSSSTTSTTFVQALDNTQVKADSDVYYLQEGADGKFEIYFGDGVVGKALSDGNIVRLRYVVTNKTVNLMMQILLQLLHPFLVLLILQH